MYRTKFGDDVLNLEREVTMLPKILKRLQHFRALGFEISKLNCKMLVKFGNDVISLLVGIVGHNLVSVLLSTRYS